MHDDETCENYQQRAAKKRKREQEAEEALQRQVRTKENKASEKIVKAVSKACPKCTARIMKNGGCDHMTCKWAFALLFVNES